MLKKLLLLAAVIGWMMAIFSFSAEPADESTQMSHETGKIVARILNRDFSDWSLESQTSYVERIDFAVRKSAHALEYALLGLLLFLAAFEWSDYLKKCGWLGKHLGLMAWLAGICYAASDELHQYFVPGRSCQFTDVLLDSAGVLAGIVMCVILIKYASARLYYMIGFVILTAVEVYIAVCVHDQFIRPYIGDVLVVAVLYFFIRMIIPDGIRHLPLYLFLFAAAVEVGQYFDLVSMMGLGDSRIARIILGSTFDWKDIACYGTGCIILFGWERWKYKRHD
ncbi:MAG: VanZ family protein [Clostridiaceae bacterium]|nr:VanZ family protein [Clostridiaceae bacterium]